MKIKANTTYYAKHTPSGEEWLLLGINQERNKYVLLAGLLLLLPSQTAQIWKRQAN